MTLNQADDEHRDRRHDGDAAYDLSHLVETGLERGLLLFCIFKELRDPAYLGVHARAGDDCHGGAGSHETAGKNDVDPVSERHVAGQNGGSVLFGGDALARQRRFVHGKALARYEAGVRGNEVARFQHDYVAGNEQRRIELAHFPAAQHAAYRRRQAFERFQRVFGAALLRHRKDDVHDDDGEHDDRLDEAAAFDYGHDEAEHAGDEQYDDGNVLKLREDLVDQFLSFVCLEYVSAVLGEARFRSFLRQTALRGHAAFTQQLFGRFFVIALHTVRSLSVICSLYIIPPRAMRYYTPRRLK